MKMIEHRETALLALVNAQGIAEDARILMAAERYARVLALAVIGCEEAGKALLHSFAALDLAPSVVAAFDNRAWNSPLLNHLFKQLAVEMIGAADAELDSYEMAAQGELPPFPPPERTARLILGCARTLSDMFAESKGVAAGKVWFDSLRSMLSRPDLFPPFESPDDEKMRGMYVDLGRSTGQPMNVSWSDAEVRLATLESTLNVLEHFRACLEDADLWAELGEQIQEVRSEYS